MKSNTEYEAVIGLEVHAQLLTETKAFSDDLAVYGDSPNTHVNPVTLGHPGTLPVFNKKALELSMRMGLATHCTINRYNTFARKNYFYADLPKGYQITQDKTPLCTGGYLLIGGYGAEKKIRIHRIHMEEDAGKSIHDLDPYYTLIDLNRAGTPLIEIVSEPDMRSADDAYAYLSEIRRLVRYIGICDGNMEEGSLRCDANISVRKTGSEQFGVKVEVKNMNSIRNVKRAIEHEIERQIQVLETGGTVVQETRSFDAAQGSTFAMRSKEMAHDYRYFPEPDLLPVVVTETMLDAVQQGMPELPRALLHKYIEQLHLSAYDADILTSEKEIAEYFEELILLTENYKAAANWMLGPVKTWMNDHAASLDAFPLHPAAIAELIALTDAGKVNFTIAAQQLFPLLLNKPDTHAEALAKEFNLIIQTDDSAIEQFVMHALEKYPDKVLEYRKGKKGLIGLFMGEVMKMSGGKADPKRATKMLETKLNS